LGEASNVDDGHDGRFHMTAPVITPIKFALNTFYSGPQAWFFLADDLGFFCEAGFEVSFVQGDTAANVVPKLGDETLSFDCGYGDVNALIEWVGQHGTACAQVVYCLHNASPYTIAVPARSGAMSISDLKGKVIASHPNDAALKMLPELALKCGYSVNDFSIELCSDPHPAMVSDMVNAARWPAMFGFVNTLRAAALEKSIDPDTQLRFFQYRDLVPQLYGAGFMVSSRFAEKHPEKIKGLVRAINRGLQVCINDVDAAIEAVARRDIKIDKAANRARLVGTLALEMAHPEGATHGIGFMNETRVQESIDLIVAAKKYSHKPEVTQIFSAVYLPPIDQRVLSLARALQ
jgi:NitT/TauT family transport system substrate-binding protein